MHRRFLATLALVLLGLVSPARAADIIADNLSNTIGGDVTITDSSWSAQAFTTLAGNVIDSIVVNMTRDGGTTGTVELYIYELDVDNKPKNSAYASVGSIDIATGLSTSPANVSFTNLNITLASTTYYLLLRGSGVANGTARWSYTDDEAGIGFPSLYTRTITSGTSWNTPSPDSPQIMQITVVPEPSTILLSYLGTIAICMATRRRQS